MASLNRVMIIGNLGQDPEIRYTAGGSAVANLSVATTEKWRDKASGEQKEQTEWHRLVAFGKTAELIGEYLKKGSAVYAEGRLQTRKWQDKSGADRYTTEIVVDKVQFLGGRGEGGGKPAAKSVGKPAAADDGTPYDDDIPF